MAGNGGNDGGSMRVLVTGGRDYHVPLPVMQRALYATRLSQGASVDDAAKHLSDELARIDEEAAT